jgi:cytochrome c-type biogenesis protein CcmH
MTRRASWALLALVVVTGLVIGAVDDDGPRTAAEHAHDLASTLRCPTCRSQSAADSDAPAAKAIRAEIARRLASGESDDEIRAYLVSRYGETILLTPSRGGVAGLVWVLPVALFIGAVATVVLVLRRWQRRPVRAPSDDGAVVVARALGDP